MGSFFIGVRFVEERMHSSYQVSHMEQEKRWRDEFEEQQIDVDITKRNAQKNLDALSARLSALQADLLRLDALGERLVNIADVSDIEFNMLEPPGLGGPIEMTTENSLGVTDFIRELKNISRQIEDRNEKFVVLESVFLNNNIQSRIIPQGELVKGGWVSSRFGWRTDPISGKREFHKGIDIVAKRNSEILAVADGIVTWSGLYMGYGNMVEISHGGSYITRYAHNKKNLVAIGDRVKKSQSIAVMGTSGRSTGHHVHFEVMYNGKHIDPRKFISKN